MGFFNWTKVVFKKLIYVNYLKLCNTLHCFKFDAYVVIHNLMCYIKFGRVSATPHCNYSLPCILLFDVFRSTLWNLVEYKLLFPVALFAAY